MALELPVIAIRHRQLTPEFPNDLERLWPALLAIAPDDVGDDEKAAVADGSRHGIEQALQVHERQAAGPMHAHRDVHTRASEPKHLGNMCVPERQRARELVVLLVERSAGDEYPNHLTGSSSSPAPARLMVSARSTARPCCSIPA